ncbi:MAG TPA: WhiB family transcriptional regulator [Patescibacteria group bacterium]|nr:WhiB family transcriptional regulator [Patescibacteria group bacterium]
MSIAAMETEACAFNSMVLHDDLLIVDPVHGEAREFILETEATIQIARLMVWRSITGEGPMSDEEVHGVLETTLDEPVSPLEAHRELYSARRNGWLHLTSLGQKAGYELPPTVKLSVADNLDDPHVLTLIEGGEVAEKVVNPFTSYLEVANPDAAVPKVNTPEELKQAKAAIRAMFDAHSYEEPDKKVSSRVVTKQRPFSKPLSACYGALNGAVQGYVRFVDTQLVTARSERAASRPVKSRLNNQHPSYDPETSTWSALAKCKKPDINPEIFFPGHGESTDPAKAVCSNCPVKELCLEDALLRDLGGVRGGESERGRRRIRRQRRVAAAMKQSS